MLETKFAYPNQRWYSHFGKFVYKTVLFPALRIIINPHSSHWIAFSFDCEITALRKVVIGVLVSLRIFFEIKGTHL